MEDNNRYREKSLRRSWQFTDLSNEQKTETQKKTNFDTEIDEPRRRPKSFLYNGRLEDVSLITKEQMKELKKKFETKEVEERNGKVMEEVLNLKKKVELVMEDLKLKEKQMFDMAQRMDKEKREANEEVTSLKRKIKSVKAECTLKENRIATLEGRLRDVNDGMESRLSAMMKEMAKMNRETQERIIERLEARNKEINEMEALKNRIATLEGRLRDVNEGMESRLSAMMKEMAKMNRETEERMEAHNKEQRREIESVKAECIQKENRIATLEGRLRDVNDGMESRLSAMMEEIEKVKMRTAISDDGIDDDINWSIPIADTGGGGLETTTEIT